MSNQTTENFWAVWQTFKWPEPVNHIYRLYYNDDGTPKCYTMEDLPGKYIEVDKETYVNHLWNVRVENQQLRIVPIKHTVQKLTWQCDHGTCCDPLDVCVVVDQNKPYLTWSNIQHEVD
jgi:hypothetical protein